MSCSLFLRIQETWLRALLTLIKHLCLDGSLHCCRIRKTEKCLPQWKHHTEGMSEKDSAYFFTIQWNQILIKQHSETTWLENGGTDILDKWKEGCRICCKYFRTMFLHRHPGVDRIRFSAHEKEKVSSSSTQKGDAGDHETYTTLMRRLSKILLKLTRLNPLPLFCNVIFIIWSLIIPYVFS